MTLTKSFKQTVRARLRQSAGFRTAVLQEALECMLSGEVEIGKSLLREYELATKQKPRHGYLRTGLDRCDA